MATNIIYSEQDAALATRIQTDLQSMEGADQVLVVVLSPGAYQDPRVSAAVDAAANSSRRVVPVLAAPVALPSLIDHLTPLDFSEGYSADGLSGRIAQESAAADRLPLKVLSSSARRSNTRTGLLLALLALVIFAIGIYGVGVLGIQMPRDEYDAVDTEAAATINAEIAPELERYANLLPRDDESATNYPATLQMIPTRLRPFAAATATALAPGAVLVTPTPEAGS
jgi:hypothetical protein